MSDTETPTELRPLTADERLLARADDWERRPRGWSAERAALFLEEADRDREYE